jgi:hypothetical protein
MIKKMNADARPKNKIYIFPPKRGQLKYAQFVSIGLAIANHDG